MQMMGHINAAVANFDRALSKVQLRFGERRGGLVSVFVHNLFLDAAEIARDLAYPQQQLTIAQLERAIGYFQHAGYRFVSPEDILNGLDPRGHYVLLTFDDGYYNNQRALPLMEAHGVPALFFVPARMIRDGIAYWWDALYRTRRREGRSARDIESEIHGYACRRTEVVRDQLARELALREFRAVGDLDRLFTPRELREFAAHPLVHVGNHGCDHEYLPAYPVAQAHRFIAEAQQIIQEITGKLPRAIAYPVGASSAEIIQSAKNAGLRLGFSTVVRKEYVQHIFRSDRHMQLGRHTLWGAGGDSIDAQCEFMRSDLGLHRRYRMLVDALKCRRGSETCQ